MQKTKLLIRLPNWVGDTIMALPSIQALKQNFEITLLGKPWLNELFAGLQLPIKTLPTEFWPARQKLKNIAIENILLFTNSLSSAMMAKFSEKKTIGYQTDGRQLFLNASIKKTQHQHEVKIFWRLAQFANEYWHGGSWPLTIPKTLNLPLTSQQQRNAEKTLYTAKITSPFFVIAPFATGTTRDGRDKIWPHWKDFIKELIKRKMCVVICPGPNEKLMANQYLNTGARILLNIDLGTYAAILAKAQQVIANDSGPMHIATAVGTQVTGIFGVSNPQRTAPWGQSFCGSEQQWPSLAEVLGSVDICLSRAKNSEIE